MKTHMKENLIHLLRKNDETISQIWTQRLGDNASLEGIRLAHAGANPTRPLLHDLVRILEDNMPTTQTAPSIGELRQLAPWCLWQVGLSHGTEVFLTGEVVVREWACAHIPATDANLLELFDLINQAFHRLYRFHSLHYCENCRTSLTHPQPAMENT